jgi:hypothetical protein
MKRQKTPKGIHYEVVEGGEIRMYKIWSRKYTAKEPFIITDDIEDFVDNMYKHYSLWNIKPNMKEVRRFVTNYINKYKTD